MFDNWCRNNCPSGFDWILLDMEHAPNEVPGILAQLQAMNASSSSAIVRAPWNDMVMIKRLLDIGAQSIMLPYVQNAEEARQAIEYTRYPWKLMGQLFMDQIINFQISICQR